MWPSSKWEIPSELDASLDAAETVGRANQKKSSTATRRSGPTMMSTLMANLHKEAFPVPWSLIKSNQTFPNKHLHSYHIPARH